MKLKLFLLIFITFITYCYCKSQNITYNFKDDINKFISDTELQNSSISFYAIDLTTNEIIGEINPNLLLSPASTMKLFTTAAALEIFGPNYTFKTDITYSGKIINNVLNGNIYIKGGGDPCFMSNNFKSNYSNFFEQIVKECENNGINKVQGKIIGDATYYSDNFAPSTWILADVANYYGASPWALSIYDNEYKLYFKTGGKSGDSTFIINEKPDIPFINLQNVVKSGNISGDQSIIYGGLFDNYRVVTGKLPLNKDNYEVKGSIPNPPIYTAMLLMQKLNKSGIIVTDSIESKFEFSNYTDSLNTQVLYSIKSPALKDIIYFTNLKSINLYAEHLLRQIGLKANGEGSNNSGIKAVSNFWQKKTGKLLMFDGSGLSRFNAVSSKQLVEVLKFMKNESKNYNSFYNSLPIAGKSGSLTSMYKGTYAENNLHAKSGYMTGVRSYAGYVKSKSSKEIAFAIIVNNYTSNPSIIKAKIEQLLVKLSEL